jgi:hypothetical protein
MNRRTTTNDGFRRVSSESVFLPMHFATAINPKVNRKVGYFLAIGLSPLRYEKASYLSDLRVARLGSSRSTIKLRPLESLCAMSIPTVGTRSLSSSGGKQVKIASL